MSFKVESADIMSYADLVRRAKDDMRAGSDYLKTSVADLADNPPSGGSQLWKGVLNQHRNLVGRVDTALNRYENVLQGSEFELMKSARYYERTDTEEASRVDSTYPGGLGKVPKPSAEATSQGFNDREDAREAIKSDKSLFGKDGPLADRYNRVVGERAESFEESIGNGKVLATVGNGVGMVLDFTSPSTLINEGLKLAFNFDLLDDFAQMVAGDWGQFDDMEDVWKDLQKLSSAVATNIAGGNETLSATWQGQAATSGWHYFNEVVKKLKEFADRFDQIISCYEELAADIVAFVNTLKAAITMILDKAIEVGLKAVAGGGLALTGVGAVLTAGAAASIAYDVLQMVDRYSDVLKALTLLFGVLNTIEGTSTSALEEELKKITNFPVPGGSYDHQAV